MRSRHFFGIVIGMVATLSVTLILGSNAWAQVNYKKLYRFTGSPDGNQPDSALVFDAAGNLYGTTALGGAYTSCWAGQQGCGTVFKLAPNSDGSWTESVLHSFAGGKDQYFPQGKLILDATGNLYGTTSPYECYDLGDCGTVFKLTANPDGSWTESVLYTFSGGADGSNPTAGLIFDGTGNLYGTTHLGGILGAGAVFKLSPHSDGTWTEKVIHSFSGGVDGGQPQSDLIFDAAGNLYGTTAMNYATGYGYGNVFELTLNSHGRWKMNLLHQFTNTSSSGVVFDGSGNLYGTGVPATIGSSNLGVVFKLTPGSTGGWGYHVLNAFKDRPGAYPGGNVIFDAAGNLYGTTEGDLSKTLGSLFEISPKAVH